VTTALVTLLAEEGARVEPSGSVAAQVDTREVSAARAAIRKVWHTLNEYRDDRWDSMRAARNQLLLAAGLVGLAAYAGTWLAIGTQVPREAMIGAAALALLGAMVGTFGQLIAQTRTSSVADDYGLSVAKMVVTPVTAGLAAVLGVLVVGAIQAGTGNLFDPAEILSTGIGSVGNMVWAAVFGLTPGLLIERIKQAEVGQVQSTMPTAGATAR
jgi:hypothetical protein